MNKKIIVIVASFTLALAMGTTAFAAASTATDNVNATTGTSYVTSEYGLMRDADGKFLMKDAFEKNLDAAIKDGTIAESDRAFYVNRFDYCVGNGDFAGGGRGCCGGRGANRG